MKILFEEHKYDTRQLNGLLNQRYFLPLNDVQSKINYVGYYFNIELNDAVLILPKVFLNKNQLAFGLFNPEDIIELNAVDFSVKDKKIKAFIYELSTWLYQAIKQFKKRVDNSTIVSLETTNTIVSNLNKHSSSQLDVILSLFNFYKKNKTLFTFIANESHTIRKRINWNKTVNKKLPLITNNKPVYTDVVSQHKRINEDEELFVLYYSTLKYLNKKYSFNFQIPNGYSLYSDKKFEKLLTKGTRYLKKIKYKYYSDKMLELYKLLFVFFEKSEKTKSSQNKEEVLLVKDFNIVFEDMIDSLIGETSILPKLKHHEDGKQLDHIYPYESLISNNDMYYIGDSKYYKAQNKPDKHSKAKQFTYAKNVIQQNINWFIDGESNTEKDYLKYRDEVTEGYNITPNFFISALVDDELNFNNSGLRQTDSTTKQCHFNNRLFDRDTLFIQHYDINFLYVLKMYISKNRHLTNDFKKSTRASFREKFIEYFNSNYSFYTLIPSDKQFLDTHYRLLQGKVFKAFDKKEEIILALENDNPQNKKVMDSITPNLQVIEPFQLK